MFIVINFIHTDKLSGQMKGKYLDDIKQIKDGISKFYRHFFKGIGPKILSKKLLHNILQENKSATLLAI
jgi:hypothetical protein